MMNLFLILFSPRTFSCCLAVPIAMCDNCSVTNLLPKTFMECSPPKFKSLPAGNGTLCTWTGLGPVIVFSHQSSDMSGMSTDKFGSPCDINQVCQLGEYNSFNTKYMLGVQK